MSYDIIKKITFNKDGSFYEEYSASNDFDDKGNLSIFKHKNDFYVKYDFLTNEQKQALFLVHSSYSGTRFYQKSWKDKLEITHLYFKDKNYRDFYNEEDVEKLKNNLNDLLSFIDNYKKESKKYIALIGGCSYLVKINKRSYNYSFSKNEAKIFKGKKEDILKKLCFIKGNVELVEI